MSRCSPILFTPAGLQCKRCGRWLYKLVGKGGVKFGRAFHLSGCRKAKS